MNISNKINMEIDKRISNKKQETVKYYVKISLTLLLISALTAGLLAFVNSVTKDKIAANELAVMENALGSMFDGCDGIKAVEGEYEAPVVAVYEVYGKGEVLGYGVQTNPVGFKAEIGIIVGVDRKGSCVGVEITSISDTPGVGTKVQDKSFLSGFSGLNGESVSGYDTISGATVSSRAVKSGVKAALDLDMFKNTSFDNAGEGGVQ